MAYHSIIVPTDEAVITFQIPRTSPAAYAVALVDATEFGGTDVIASDPSEFSRLNASGNPATSSIRVGGERLIEPRSKVAQPVLRDATGDQPGSANRRRHAHDSKTNSLESSTGSSRMQG